MSESSELPALPDLADLPERQQPILVAVNDSAAGFAAVEVAIDYAKRLGAHLAAVTVLESAAPALSSVGEDAVALAARRAREADSILSHVIARGAQSGVVVTTHRRTGSVAAEILAEATASGAGLLVIALVDKPSHAIPYIGSHTLRVLEFATMPVLVVPVFHPSE
jgi:nucleotide-binding universal stress UspA family protein